MREQEALRLQTSNSKTNPIIQLTNWLIKIFIVEKFCFVVLGTIFGIVLSHCLQWTDHDSEYKQVYQPAPIMKIDNPDQMLPSPPSTVTSMTTFDSEFLNGLAAGMSMVKKKHPSTSKKVRVMYIIGNEGSGHHLWENIMKEMAEHSELVSSDYIENNVVLVECLHSCYMELYHTKKSKLETAQERAYHDTKRKEVQSGSYVEYACDSLVPEFKKMVDNVPDGALVYLRSFSYPFFGVTLAKVPNVLALINAAQQVPEIDLRFILMKREWVNCVVSACVHRYGACKERVQMQPALLSMIQTQLMSMDPDFWIMVDYEDFISRPMDYIGIIQDWLLIKDKDLIKNAIEKIVTPSTTSTAKSGWDEINKSARDLGQMLKNLLYSDDAKHQWPVYNSSYFLVSPDNRQFLDSKSK